MSRTIEDILTDWRSRGHDLVALRALAQSRSEPLRSALLEALASPAGRPAGCKLKLKIRKRKKVELSLTRAEERARYQERINRDPLRVASHLQPGWAWYQRHWRGCRNLDCGLWRWAWCRVLARGSLPCDLLFIGEAPGKRENALGVPFVGRAGKVLDALLEALPSHCSSCVDNLVLCRPCEGRAKANRAPSTGECGACREHLIDLYEMASPKGMVLLGKTAQESIGTTFDAMTLALPHPAWILRKGGIGSTEFRKASRVLRKFAKEIL